MMAASTVVFLLFGPYLTQFLRVCSTLDTASGSRNAMWFLWEPDDIQGLLGAMLIGSVGAVLARELLRACRFARTLRVFDHAFVVAFGAGVLTNVWFHTQRPEGYRIGQCGVEMQTAWLLLIGMVGSSLTLSRSRLVGWSVCLSQIAFPATIIVAYQLFQLPTLERPQDSLTQVTPRPCSLNPVPPVGASLDKPVYLFIFDEWSYRRTYEQGRCRSDLPNIARLSDQAIVFHQAHSPGPATIYSMPGLLRGTPDTPELDRRRPGFMKTGSFAPCTEYPSIFSRAGCGDYRKLFVSWGFATHLWVSEELDVMRAYSFYARGDSFVTNALLHWYNAGRFWTDPWSAFAYNKIDMRVADAHALDLYRRIDQDTKSIIHLQDPRTFAIIHYPVPHHPFLLNPDGTFHGRDWGEEGYERNLAYLDRVIGKLVSEMKSAKRYDDSMLILTSDHSLRRDPDVPNPSREELTHVPLIIKLPGQTESQRVDDDFRTCHLGEFIHRALQGRTASPAVAVKTAE